MDPAKLGKSYLSMDTDGRVIRTDSFSKIMAPGFRTGWISAAEPFRDRLSLYMLSSTMGTCSMTAVRPLPSLPSVPPSTCSAATLGIGFAGWHKTRGKVTCPGRDVLDECDADWVGHAANCVSRG